jgi:hypothetical protein
VEKPPAAEMRIMAIKAAVIVCQPYLREVPWIRHVFGSFDAVE